MPLLRPFTNGRLPFLESSGPVQHDIEFILHVLRRRKRQQDSLYVGRDVPESVTGQLKQRLGRTKSKHWIGRDLYRRQLSTWTVWQPPTKSDVKQFLTIRTPRRCRRRAIGTIHLPVSRGAGRVSRVAHSIVWTAK